MLANGIPVSTGARDGEAKGHNGEQYLKCSA